MKISNFINREIERKVFRRMLSFKDNARLLTFKDHEGRGKSFLLKRLQYECNYFEDIPASLVSLGESKKIASPFHLVKAIRNDLKRFGGLKFGKFDALDAARILKDPAPFTDSVRDNISDGRINIVIQNVENLHLHIQWRDDEHEELARQYCIAAFLEDLKAISMDTPVVILLDDWEACDSLLQRWIIESMLDPFCFSASKRPDKLIFVLAGREMPPLKERLGDNYSNLVISFEKLSNWTPEHMKAFLEVHGYKGVDKQVVSMLTRKVNHGKSLNWALNAVKELITAKTNTADLKNLHRPIGLSRQLKMFESILATKAPALVIVTGPPDSGKSTFLQMAVQSAKKLKWHVPSPTFKIDSNLTPKELERRLKKQLESFSLKPEHDSSFLRRIIQARKIRKETQSVAEEPSGGEPAPTPGNSVSQIPENESGNIETAVLLPIVQKLKRVSPILIPIDGYQPNMQFSSWFTSNFIADILKCEASIVLVVADLPHTTDGLAKLAGHKIKIKGIPKRAVEQHFKRLKTYRQLALNDKEVQVYTNEVVNRPHLFGPLTRMLLLSKTNRIILEEDG